MSLDLFTAPPSWTVSELHAEKTRRLAEDLAVLGSRPRWWQPRLRRHYDRTVARLNEAHESNLRTMLATQDPVRRAITANLIGWRPQTESHDVTILPSDSALLKTIDNKRDDKETIRRLKVKP